MMDAYFPANDEWKNPEDGADDAVHKSRDDIMESATHGIFIKIDQLFDVKQFKVELNEFLEPKFKKYLESEEKTEEMTREVFASIAVLSTMCGSKRITENADLQPYSGYLLQLLEDQNERIKYISLFTLVSWFSVLSKKKTFYE